MVRFLLTCVSSLHSDCVTRHEVAAERGEPGGDETWLGHRVLGFHEGLGDCGLHMLVCELLLQPR